MDAAREIELCGLVLGKRLGRLIQGFDAIGVDLHS
jgi:hypothetical protein